MELKELQNIVRVVPNFPIEGIMFRDISPLLSNVKAFASIVEKLSNLVKDCDKIVAVEARGFPFGAAVAYATAKPFVMARKKGKLPGEVLSKEYTYDYATASLSLQVDAIKKGEKVVIIDDVLATGSTTLTTKELVEEEGGEVVRIVHVIEVVDLGGRELLQKNGCEVESILIY